MSDTGDKRPTLSRTPKPPKVERPATPARQAPLPRRDAPPSVNPKRVRGGVKLAGKDGPSTHWIAQRWIRLLEEGCAGEPNVEGLDYAKMGQTRRLERRPGVIEASVQGRSQRPYTVRLTLGTFDHAAWERVVAAVAEQPIYSAKLVAGDVPEHIEDLFHPLGLHLFPRGSAEVTPSCTCGHPHPWCKHVACVMYLVADALAADPFVIFNLRGVQTEALLERLRQRRASTGSVHGAPPVYAAHVPGASDGEAAPLDAGLDRFWEAGPGLEGLDLSIEPPRVNKALLRRLGPSPFEGGRFPLVGLLATCYDTISEAAVRQGAEEPGQDAGGDAAGREPVGAPPPEPAAGDPGGDEPEGPSSVPAHVRRAMKVKAKASRARPAGE